MTKFYMMKNGAAYLDIPLKADNWEDAIAEVRRTSNYATTKRPKKIRDKRGLDSWIDVYCGKLRKELSTEDLHNPQTYRKIY